MGTLPSAIQADVVDDDELLSGPHRRGPYIGVGSVACTLAAAIGVGLALPIFGRAGYVAQVPLTPEVLLTLRARYALVPSLRNLLGFAIALASPTLRARHAAIREGIRVRRVVADRLRTARMPGATS